MNFSRGSVVLVSMTLTAVAAVAYFSVASLQTLTYDGTEGMNANAEESDKQKNTAEEKKEPEFIVTHLPTPEPVRAIYMTSWVAGEPDRRAALIRLIEETELNAVVIDIKDYSGKISFITDHPVLAAEESHEHRISDIVRFIGTLHDKGIYVIGRVTVFQDPHLAAKHPEWAVRRESDGGIWKDYKGLSYIDPGAREAWDYIVALAEESYAVGFDEINFDYIRFPSDGNMKDIAFPASGSRPRADVIEEFFAYLHGMLGGTGMVLSADLFGMTTTNTDDLNIGQVLERAEPHFDYIAPMVYPSHYPPTFNGYADPNDYPYEVVKYSMERAVTRLKAASSTPSKLRPWLQDFDYGGNYGPEEVRAQIQATYDAGLNSWMLWDPANKYTPEALLPN